MSTIDYDALAVHYAQHRRVHRGVFAQLAKGLGPASRVLEVGCGTGNYLMGLREATGCDCTGIEPSAGMMASFRARDGAIPLVDGRAEDLPFPTEAFDLVFSVDVIHHVVDRSRAVHEAFRVLRAGGRLCIVTDSEWVIRNREPLSVYFPETAAIDLARYPGVEALTRMMTEAGFACLVETLAEARYEVSDAAPYRDRVFSSLQILSDELHQAGLRRMEDDLRRGPIPCTSRYTLLRGTKVD